MQMTEWANGTRVELISFWQIHVKARETSLQEPKLKYAGMICDFWIAQALWELCGNCIYLIVGIFLQLMDKECYKDIEKIKTIGSTYMAAVGLVPTVGTEVRK